MDTWENDPHEIADKLNDVVDNLGYRGRYSQAATVHTAAQMLRDLWDTSEIELQELQLLREEHERLWRQNAELRGKELESDRTDDERSET